ncbi:inhibitor of trypsin and hageman factor-like [Olea europaea var. sylvestris]|uniref:inhibitor of trypsin and hageman factor-like n=1 Tax=Olea europaea var. sylvestris TaxID=158386 RepID=UPI000C1D277D|nr:inhibitor of trypsin and hageman factor-like [Olea europaea var. sylvestris]
MNPYPPCANGSCTDRACCTPGYKYRWPNTLGMDGEKAKRIIEKDNPLVTGVIVPDGNYVIDNFCCNRVWIFVNKQGKVILPVPMVG